MLDGKRCRAIGFAVAVALLMGPVAVAGKKDVKGEYAVTEISVGGAFRPRPTIAA